MASVSLLIYMCAALATGYTYLPAKRGGFLLSGLPTLLLVLAASGLFLAALLTIIDHYDKRPNEASYAALRRYSLRAALYLFIAAPLVEALHRLLLVGNIDVLPQVHGLAEHSTFYSPGLNQYAQYVAPIEAHGWLLLLLMLVTAGLGAVIDKYSSKLKRVTMGLFSVSMLCLSTMMLTNTTHDFLTGEVTAGRRSHKYTVHAEREPAKFNAILLTNFAMGGVMLTFSTFGLVVVLTGRLKRAVR